MNSKSAWAGMIFLTAFSGAIPAEGVEATLAHARRVELGFPVSGVIEKVDVAAGQRVAKGQLLARLDDTPFRAVVEQGEAEVTTRTADHHEAVRDAKQAQELYDRSVLSTVELENARSKTLRAEAALKDARARLTQARYALSRSRLIAPFDAWVVDVRAVAGATVVSAFESRPQVVLAAHGEYLARARAPAAVLAKTVIGATVTVQTGGRGYSGKIQSVALEPIDEKSGKGNVHEVTVQFQSAEALRPGQSARIDLP